MLLNIYKLKYFYFIVLAFYLIKCIAYNYDDSSYDDEYYDEDGNIILNAVAYADSEYNEIYSAMVNDFNEYAQNNNLKIKIKINVYTNANNKNFEFFATSIESLLIKRLNKYDIYYFDNGYTQKYGPYLLDLKEYLSEDHINMYNKEIVEKSCTYNDKIVGLPFNLAYTVLYSNKILLEKYNKTIPTTWDELIETSKYILEQENNPDLIGYNGLFDESENGICSIYEFIYSFRDSLDSDFPDIRSNNTIKALTYMKKLKDEISSDEVFKSDFAFSMYSLQQNLTVFTKFYSLTYSALDIIPYYMSPLPGYKEGISGSIIAGYNIGIDGNIPLKKLYASLTAFKFLSSKELQRKYFLIENILSGISSFYDDEEICKKVNCEVIKNLQPISRPSSEYYQFTDYVTKIENYVYKFLYGNQTAESVLEQIDYLTKIHYVSINGEKQDSSTKLAKTFFILVIFLSCLMAGLLLLLKSEKYKPYFSYLPTSSWIISILGLIVVVSNCYTTLGPVTSTKCHLYVILLIFGYTLNLIPILHQYIVDLPVEHKIFKWIREHKIYFFLLFILFDCILVSLFSIKIYNVDIIMISEGKNFETCKLRNNSSLFVLMIVLLSYMSVIFFMLIVSYVEWGRQTLVYDIQGFVIAIYSDAFTVFLLFILNFISFKNYLLQYVIRNVFTLIPVITSFIFIYGYRVYMPHRKEKEDENIIQDLKKESNSLTESKNSSVHNSTGNVILKLQNYHNQSKLSNSSINSGNFRSNNSMNDSKNSKT
ncbi:periplasmic binding protein-like II [Anaeromyces robustus]|uniref:Periplasmic binding protein-like II n=1 Tax=Anaeromyces robustus TaxID=1754192 RepID=A0A1Y1UX71_9FUNG|nr:periplasmic binding protein-like II [Anaeromyces robustus]|eukprot:ORX42272.1 periplasmic binding protein-like II [Anaeromyces robustus]